MTVSAFLYWQGDNNHPNFGRKNLITSLSGIITPGQQAPVVNNLLNFCPSRNEEEVVVEVKGMNFLERCEWWRKRKWSEEEEI